MLRLGFSTVVLKVQLTLLQSRAAQHCRRAAPGDSFGAGIQVMKHFLSGCACCPLHFSPMFLVTEIVCIREEGSVEKKVRSRITGGRLDLMLCE